MDTLSNPIGAAGTSPDPLTDRVRATWMAGDFGRIARGYERGAAEFIARLALEADERVLDVACGTGNLTIPAACTGATVTGIDIAPNLVEQAQMRAVDEELTIAFDIGDAEHLPYDAGTFDTVVTMFGTMFAARSERAAAELLRVTRPRGRVAMASWTPTGLVGEMFKTTARYVPPAPGVASPLLWGTEQHVQARLGAGCSSLKCERRLMTFEFPFSPAEVVDLFRLFYGPSVRAFALLSPTDQAKLLEELTQLWSENNRANDDTTRVQSEYLEVVGVVL